MTFQKETYVVITTDGSATAASGGALNNGLLFSSAAYGFVAQMIGPGILLQLVSKSCVINDGMNNKNT